MGINNTPRDKYLYIRAELQTYKDYSSFSDIYRTDYGLYHSFTNPIWIKLSAIDAS